MLVLRKNNQDTFNNIVNHFFKDEFMNTENKINRGFFPKSNISETEKSFTIELSVPGYKKEDISIELHNNNLVISSSINEEKEDKKESYYLNEFSKGSFSRSFTLNEKVETGNISAAYENGILTIIIPKKEEAFLKRLIKIN